MYAPLQGISADTAREAIGVVLERPSPFLREDEAHSECASLPAAAPAIVEYSSPPSFEEFLVRNLLPNVRQRDSSATAPN